MEMNNKEQVFGAYFEDGKKLRFYNCAPIKAKVVKKKPETENPNKKKLFGKLFKTSGSGSELSIDSDATTTSK